MKKYFITAVAALSLGGFMTSCTHDIDGSGSSGDVATNAQESYEQAFLNTFGRPIEGFDWGFGTGNATSRALTRSIISEINDPFTKENTATYYKSADDVPATAMTYTDFCNQDKFWPEGWQVPDLDKAQKSDAEILIPEGTHTIKFTAGKHDFYVTGDATLNVTDYINAARIYILPGKTFTLNMNNYINDLEIYVANGATLNYNYDKLYNQDGGGKIYNHGTVNLKKDNFEVNQDAIFYNEGSVTGKNITSKPGDGHPSYLYNFGDIDLTGYFQLNSCANFFNEGNFTVAGKTEITQGKSLIWWINKGHYETDSFESFAWNGTCYNYCQLFVEHDALIQNGVFHLMDGSYAEINRGIFNNLKFLMRDNSGINIKSGTLWGRDGSDFRTEYDTQGFEAVDDNAKAYVRLGGTNKIPAHKGSAFHLKGKNLTLAYYEIIFYHELYHFGNTWNDNVDQFANVTTEEALREEKNENTTWNTHDVTKIFTGDDFATITPTPKANDCGATWNGGNTPPDNPVTPTTDKVRVIAEDLTTLDGKADFDFNDVVFDVDLLSNNQVRITLLAAGGTLPLTVGDQGQQESGDYEPTMEMQYDSQGQEMESVMKYEVHRLFKVATTTMVNTNAAGGANRDAVEVIIDNPSTSSDIHEIANAIPIRVYKKSTWIELEKAVPVGTRSDKLTASKVAVDGTFQWCAERVSINKDSRYQYSNYKGTQKSRFELYLDGKLGAKWWDQSTVASE